MKRPANLAVTSEVDESELEFTPALRARLIRLARSHSIVEISRADQMPCAEAIYRRLERDVEFRAKIEITQRAFRSARREELNDFVRKLNATDLSRIFVELKKLQRHVGPLEATDDQYDLEKLSLEELRQLKALLQKSLPDTHENSIENDDNA